MAVICVLTGLAPLYVFHGVSIDSTHTEPTTRQFQDVTVGEYTMMRLHKRTEQEEDRKRRELKKKKKKTEDEDDDDDDEVAGATATTMTTTAT